MRVKASVWFQSEAGGASAGGGLQGDGINSIPSRFISAIRGNGIERKTTGFPRGQPADQHPDLRTPFLRKAVATRALTKLSFDSL